MKTVVEKAYAKINWYLAVGERRADGYHTILSLMQNVSLADQVTVTWNETPGIRLQCRGNVTIPTDATNLAWVAAERYFAYIGREPAVTIEIDKHIPVGAGLAGGSADAAAVLRAINRIFDCPVTDEELENIARGIGSDVPFCVSGGLALARGRGELLTPLEPCPRRYLLLVNEGEYVSTAKAYAMLDARATIDPLGDCRELLTALRSTGEIPNGLLRNDFAPAVLPHCPRARAALRHLRELGGTAQMSGSGSTVFAVFPNEAAAKAAAREMPESAILASTL